MGALANELWTIGLTGGAIGGALAWPLLCWPAARSGDGARLLGVMLLIGGAATVFISTIHGGLLPPMPRHAATHLVYAGDLLFWSLLVLWMREVTGRPMRPWTGRLIAVAPLTVYAAATAARGFSVPGFIWLLPAGVAAAAYAGLLWRRRAPARAAWQAALASRMVVVAVALNLAQTLRTFWPEVEWLREIVPITMTACFLSIGTLAMRMLVVARRDEDRHADEAPRYERSALGREAATRLLAAIDHGMHEQRWYRDRTLTLAALASRIDARPHAVSQALNQAAGRSFNEYVNGWRVADARSQLQDPANDRFTIDAIAEAAGFSSRSAFYMTFKRLEGITPTAFRARARLGRSSR